MHEHVATKHRYLQKENQLMIHNSPSETSDSVDIEHSPLDTSDPVDIEYSSCGRWECCFLVAALITCAVGISMTVSVNVMSRQVADLSSSDTSPRVYPEGVCLQCVKLLKNVFDPLKPDHLVDRLVKRVDNGIQMCCAENDDQLSLLLEATMRDQVTRPIPTLKDVGSSLQFTPVSVHKQLHSDPEFESSLTGNLLNGVSKPFLAHFNKDYHDILTEHVREISVLESALQIEHTGMYYVYLSVHVVPKFTNHEQNNLLQDWGQLVYRKCEYSLENSDVLLETSQTGCPDSSPHEETSFVGGTFHLVKGDHIQVYLSGPGLVHYKKESSYLGLMMLSN